VAALIALHRDNNAGLERHLEAGGQIPDLAGWQRVYSKDLTRARALAAERARQPADAAAILAPFARPEYAGRAA
jgi:hypothetical protein